MTTYIKNDDIGDLAGMPLVLAIENREISGGRFVMVSLQAVRDIVDPRDTTIAQQAAEIKRLRTALNGLMYPNVPGADDIRVLIAALGGHGKKSYENAMALADKLEAAQDAGRAALLPAPQAPAAPEPAPETPVLSEYAAEQVRKAVKP